MSPSPLKIRFSAPLRNVRAGSSREQMLCKSEVDHLLREQYLKGIDAGQKSLGQQLLQQRNDLLELQNGVLRSLQETLPRVVQDCEQALVGIALDIAKRVLGEVPMTVELVEAAVRSALNEIKGVAEYQVHVHPDDLNLLQAINSDLLPAAGAPVIFNADETISRGGCLVRTRLGTIDGRRETKWKRVEEALT